MIRKREKLSQEKGASQTLSGKGISLIWEGSKERMVVDVKTGH